MPYFGNVGTIVSFRVGAANAACHLARELAPMFSPTDLTSLPNYSVYLRLLIDGELPLDHFLLPLSIHWMQYRV